jgi:phage terminase small subunit
MPVLANLKHEVFAQLLAQGTPASPAYVKAGYKKDDANAVRLAGNDKVRTRVRELAAEGAERAGVTIDRVIAEMAKIGFSDIRKAVSWDGNRVEMLQSHAIDDDTAGAIAEVAKTKDGVRIKFHDKASALLNLGKHLGMFREQQEISGRIEVSWLPPQ